MFSMSVARYFSSLIKFTSSEEIYSNEYELVFHFRGKRGRRRMGNYGL